MKDAPSAAARIAVAVFALSVGAGALVFRLELSNAATGADPTLVDYEQALRRNSANGYRWADMAESLADAGRVAEAREAFTRAVAISPRIPPIWLRYTNFCFLHNDLQQGLRIAARVLATVPDYDGILFHYFDRIVEDPAAVLAAIGEDRRATRAWLGHMMEVNDAASARNAWNRINAAGFGDDKLAAAYAGYLLGLKAWEEALTVWSGWLGKRRGQYPERNLLFNGDFQTEPLPGLLDWQMASVENQFDTVLANRTVTIRFFGKENVSYDHLSQVAILPRAGYYRLSMRVKTEGITTNEGIRLAVTDLGLATEPIVGTHEWMTVSLDVAVNQPRAVRVAVVRRRSGKLDNKIEGTAWIEALTLIPTNALKTNRSLPQDAKSPTYNQQLAYVIR